jgi:hypothetical protein
MGPGVRRDDPLIECAAFRFAGTTGREIFRRPHHSANGRYGKQNLKETARLRSIKLSSL